MDTFNVKKRKIRSFEEFKKDKSGVAVKGIGELQKKAMRTVKPKSLSEAEQANGCSIVFSSIGDYKCAAHIMDCNDIDHSGLVSSKEYSIWFKDDATRNKGIKLLDDVNVKYKNKLG